MDMEALNGLVQMVTGILVPYLPTLTQKAGEGAAAEVGKRTLGSVWDRAKKIWALLWPSVDATPELHRAVERAAADPSNVDTVAALRIELRELLAREPELTAALRRLMNEMQVSTVQAVGERSVAIGGDAIGAQINTGDIHE